MQLKKSVLVGVLMTLCLSTDSWSHYIPEKKSISSFNKKNDTSLQKDQIQKCGIELTNFIIEACNGILNSPYQDNNSKGAIQRKIKEDCCDKKCALDYLQSYCGDTPLFIPRKTVQQKHRNRLNASDTRNLDAGKSRKHSKNDKEVRIKGKRIHKSLGHEGQKKKKRSFKWKCTFKSFGHYLFKIDRDNRVRNNISKRNNSINRTWPSIQIGTISPEMDKFGGPPIVVGKRNKISSL